MSEVVFQIPGERWPVEVQPGRTDLISPAPEFGFPGLKPGDRWCVCAATWRQAFEAGVASPVVLAATHEETLAIVPLDALKKHALDLQ